MFIQQLDDVFPDPQFVFNEAYSWLGKKVYVKHIGKTGYVAEMKRMKVGYALLVVCDGFSLLLTKPQFAKWIEIKPQKPTLSIVPSEET
jgi:hypothetical protein